MKEWEINSQLLPSTEFVPPLSYSSLRTFHECRLRFFFIKDHRFAAKTSPHARMGTAFHAALASIKKGEIIDLESIIQFFRNALRDQRAIALTNYREKKLIWPKELRIAMENVLAVQAGRITAIKMTGTDKVIETTLRSSDGLLIGRPDEILETDHSTIIVDYKTGHYYVDKLPSYEHQILFYAGLWEEIRGEMPNLGKVNFLLEDRCHNFEIVNEKVRTVLMEARDIIRGLSNHEFLPEARTGEHCSHCEYRPWCKDYWHFYDVAQPMNSSDINGVICGEHPRDSHTTCLKCGQLHMTILNRDMEPFKVWSPGTQVRALDLVVEENIRLRTPFSEMFRILD